MDPEDLYVKGSVFSSPTQSIRIQVELIKCDSTERDDCKSEEEIYKHFGAQTFALVKNEVRFDSDVFRADSIIREGTIEAL